MGEHIDVIYNNLARDVLENGERVDNGRTKEAYYSVFGRQIRVNLQDGFPALTGKKLFFRGVAVESCWILRGDTNIKYLLDNNVHIWDEWATAEQTARFPPARLMQKYMKHDKYKFPLWMGLGFVPIPVQVTYKVGQAIDLGYAPEAADDLVVLHKINERIIDIVEGMLEKGLDRRRAAQIETREKFYDRISKVPETFKQMLGGSEVYDPKLEEDDIF